MSRSKAPGQRLLLTPGIYPHHCGGCYFTSAIFAACLERFHVTWHRYLIAPPRTYRLSNRWQPTAKESESRFLPNAPEHGIIMKVDIRTRKRRVHRYITR